MYTFYEEAIKTTVTEIKYAIKQNNTVVVQQWLLSNIAKVNNTLAFSSSCQVPIAKHDKHIVALFLKFLCLVQAAMLVGLPD